MFTHRNVPNSELLSTPAPRYAGLPLDFRPPERYEPPAWWDGPGCGDCGGGGGFNGDNTLHEFWRDLAHDDDPFVVRMVFEYKRVGNETRGFERVECRIKSDHLSALQLRRLSVLTKEAADLLDG